MNSPMDGYVADIIRRTRALYHYTIRKLKNNAELLRKSAMARAINDNNSRQLWTEVYKLEIKILLLVIVLMMYLVMLILQTYSLTNTLYCIILLLLKNLLWIIY